jgi:hypothetical protein
MILRLATVFLVCLAGCASGRGAREAVERPVGVKAPGEAIRTEKPSEWVTRTSSQEQLTLAVSVARETMIGHPVRVVVEFSNQSKDAVMITYSRPIRLVRPVVTHHPMGGKAPLTDLGRRDLTGREETSNLSGSVKPGETWKYEFDLGEYFQLDVPMRWYLGVAFWPERVDPKTGERHQIPFEMGGIEFSMRKDSG